MVIYDIQCHAGHRFEGWFSKPEDYIEQSENGLLSCPVCSSTSVKKVPTASYVQTSSSRQIAPAKEEGSGPNAIELLHQIRSYIDDNYDDVGTQFADEARKMYYGETEERNIRGSATADEANALYEEGIDVIALPPLPNKSKLN